MQIAMNEYKAKLNKTANNRKEFCVNQKNNASHFNGNLRQSFYFGLIEKKKHCV